MQSNHLNLIQAARIVVFFIHVSESLVRKDRTDNSAQMLGKTHSVQSSVAILLVPGFVLNLLY